jgi:hypothetical protein
VLAVGTATAIATIPGGGDLLPAQAPGSLTSLGWTYDLADTVDSAEGEVRSELEPSDLPRLVSWATDGDAQAVVVRLQGSEKWASDVGDYGDYVWVPPGFQGRVTVSGPSGLALATYELDQSASPEGVGEGVRTYRTDVAGYVRAGAGVGDPGEAAIVVPLDVESGELQLAYACPGLPRGYQVQIGVVGEAGWFSSGNDCASGAGFDPGGSANIGLAREWGPEGALNMWVTHRGEPVADNEVPDLRLSLAAYAYAEEPLRLAGQAFPQSLEYGGKVFEVVDSVETPAGQLPRLTVPGEGDYLVDAWVVASPQTPYRISIDGTTGGSSLVSGLESSGTGPRLVEPGAAEVGIEVSGNYVEDVRRTALVLYRRVE